VPPTLRWKVTSLSGTATLVLVSTVARSVTVPLRRTRLGPVSVIAAGGSGSVTVAPPEISTTAPSAS
jgi:hypothetical protein